ncbi:lipoxygenase [Mumia flava]|uniref:Lipoxygenase n=1 Tax=Mumia flava TaxID=1348852 RepID=A0A0B2BRE2_9ACTN|nr:lipoxygenase family protein [Mumia flava]PJJ54390.1 lipoxygenase [Mumia flava]
MSAARFWLYRTVLAFLTMISFRLPKVYPLEVPEDGTIDFVPYGEIHPEMPITGLSLPTTFPASDRAEKRLRVIRMESRLIALVRGIAPRRTPPVATDERRFLRTVYPWFFRRAWPTAPTLPKALATTDDLVAELAARGPFASGLRRVDDDRYAFGSDWVSGYPAVPGLAQPGGVASLVVRDGALVTQRLTSPTTSDGAADGGGQAQAALIAGANEELTIFRHNVDVHLSMLTPFALASHNRLSPDHPVRRLVHHCFDTVLIGNRQLASAQLSGPRGFLASTFSHRADVLRTMVEDHLGHFDFWDFEPPTQFERRGTTSTPFPYPYRDNVMRFWDVTRDYVDRYLALYYDGDAAVAADPEIGRWVDELNRLMPNGVGDTLTRDRLGRVCATLIHVSTVEHDILNNVVWDYTTLGWVTPTVVPASGELMDQRRAFDLVATLIGTWKPYNMLLTADVPKLALDARAASVMADWIADLSRLQDAMDAQPRDPSLSYPAGLNTSISN